MLKKYLTGLHWVFFLPLYPGKISVSFGEKVISWVVSFRSGSWLPFRLMSLGQNISLYSGARDKVAPSLFCHMCCPSNPCHNLHSMIMSALSVERGSTRSLFKKNIYILAFLLYLTGQSVDRKHKNERGDDMHQRVWTRLERSPPW